MFSFDKIGNSSVIESTYSSELIENSEMFARLTNGPSNYYYEAIQVNVFESGCYNLISNSTMDTYGYIYRNYFNPLIPTDNLLVKNDRSFRSNQFELIIRLQYDTEHILVLTTNDENVTETFWLLVTGPKNVSFNRISKHLYYCEMSKDRFKTDKDFRCAIVHTIDIHIRTH